MAAPEPKRAKSEISSLLTTVSDALVKQADKSLFAVGGRINVDKLVSVGSNVSEKSPIVLRWDSGELNHCHKASLPVLANDSASGEAFAKLLEDSEPATYGVGNKEVLDETYRKAGKMNAARFSTNLNPYEHGVIDAIAQALAHGQHRGIRAELYNLNVYSGPSGKFKPHVDTPRSRDQMGSLVVCLPHPHQGGQLAIRHHGREVTFDWASSNATSIQWAAFFSDCEHEVLEVTSGHRLTLAYNLYWTSFGPASMADNLNVLEPESMYFFSALQALLQCPDFLPEGGLLGFTCTHTYPHTSKAAATTLHHTLKGLDMLVYQALKRLTGSVKVTHALDDHAFQEWRLDCDENGRDDENGKEDENPELPHATPTTIGTSILGPITWTDYEEDGHPAPENLRYEERVVSSHGVCWTNKAAYFRDHVTWLNHAPQPDTPQELAVAYLAYGNQPGLGVYYSSAVIVADFRVAEKLRRDE